MKAILIDTTGSSLEIALRNSEHYDYIFREGLRHSLTLQSALEELLERNNLVPSDLDAIGVVVGPGSFTGIRIGIATAKAIGYALKTPVFGVNSLFLLAKNSNAEHVAMDASNGFAYYAAFGEHTVAPCCITVDELKQIGQHKVVGYPFGFIPKQQGLQRVLRELTDADFVTVNDLEPLYIRKPQAEQ